MLFRSYVLKRVGTTKSISMKGYVPSVVVINKIEDETHLLVDCQRYSSMTDMFRMILSKTETKIDDIRKLAHENLISQMMNSNDYHVNLRLMMFISSCFEMRDKLI